MCMLFYEQVLTVFGRAGSTCSARGEGVFRKARRDVSERVRRLSEDLVDGAIMWVSSRYNFRVDAYSHRDRCTSSRVFSYHIL